MHALRFVFLFAVAALFFSCHEGTGKISMTLEAPAATSDKEFVETEAILRKRLNSFGVDEPTFTREGNLLKVELANLDIFPETGERIRRLMQSTANLEFWETYNAGEIYLSLSDALKRPPIDSASDDSTRLMRMLFERMAPNITSDRQFVNSCMFGIVALKDTSLVRQVLDSARASGKLPSDLVFAWTRAKPGQQGGYTCELILLKGKRGKAAMVQPMITDAHVAEQDYGIEISMTMDKVSGDRWRNLTKDNVGKCIAVVLDGIVYTYPTVQSEITGGMSSITGDFTKKEADDIVTVLKTGHLPVPVRIVEYNETKSAGSQ